MNFDKKYACTCMLSLLVLTSCDAESSADKNKLKEYSMDMLNCNEETNTCYEKETNTPITGIVKEYYDNSHKRIKSEESYKDGLLNGSEKFYYISGKIKSEATYVSGKLNGILKEYYSNGNLKIEAAFENDVQNGIIKTYYENGQLEDEATLKNGISDGTRKKYYEDGKLSFEGSYKDGSTINEINYNHDGKKTSEIVFSDTSGYTHKGYEIIYNPDGSIKKKEELIAVRKEVAKPHENPSTRQQNGNNMNVSSGVCTNYNYCLRIKDEYERIASTSYCPMIKNEGTPLAQMMANEYKKVEQKYWNEINQKCPASSCNQNDFNLDPFRFCHF